MSSLILIADAETETANTLDAELRRQGFRTVCAADGQEALDLHDRLKPDLVILDADLPRRDGWDVLGELRRRGETPVMMTAVEGGGLGRLQALRIGADDYLVRPFDPIEVAARVQAILRRSGAPDGKLLRVGAVEVNAANYLATVVRPEGRRKLDLTLTEFRILAHMAGNPLRVFSREELTRTCFPSQRIQTRTVDSHVSHLRRKLIEGGAGGLLANVRGVGYRLEPDA